MAEDSIPLERSGWPSAMIQKAGVFIGTPWRARAADALVRQPAPPNLEDVYQFGVYTGGSLRIIRGAWQQRKLPLRAVWGLDSFVGLQDDSGALDGHKTIWSRGSYSAADAFGTESFADVKLKILQHATGTRHLWNSTFAQKLQFVRGFYNESLTPNLASELGMRPAAYVDIDVDQYVPTEQALRWLLENKLLRPGSLVGYDDFGSTPLWRAGESRAHLEIAQRFRVRFELVSSECRQEADGNETSPCQLIPANGCGHNFHPVFRVQAVGRGRGAACVLT